MVAAARVSVLPERLALEPGVKYSFQLKSANSRRSLPHKMVIGKGDTETEAHVILKLLGFLMFFRERLHIEANLHMDSIPFVPDVVELDYELRPVLWVECGDCSAAKLNKIAVKAPEAEIWVIKRNAIEADELLRSMRKEDLRRDRYRIIALDEIMFGEMCGSMRARNEMLWMGADFEDRTMQFDFNGFWFDAAFEIRSF